MVTYKMSLLRTSLPTLKYPPSSPPSSKTSPKVWLWAGEDNTARAPHNFPKAPGVSKRQDEKCSSTHVS